MFYTNPHLNPAKQIILPVLNRVSDISYKQTNIRNLLCTCSIKQVTQI